MFESDSIYAPGPIRPVAKIKENLSIWTQNRWEHHRIEYIEPMPYSSPMVVEMVTASGITSLVANGTIARRVVNILQLNSGELLHLRWQPLENVEGVLWEQSGIARFQSRSALARVTLDTPKYDPYLATSTFWILGRDRDMNLEVRNPMGYATALARFIFWGYRYILKTIDIPDTNKTAMAAGDLDTVRRLLGATTWIPAEGRSA